MHAATTAAMQEGYAIPFVRALRGYGHGDACWQADKPSSPQAGVFLGALGLISAG